MVRLLDRRSSVAAGRAAFERWRELGPRDGTAAAWRMLRAAFLPVFRRARLRVAPLTVSDEQLKVALGGRELIDVFRGSVVAALPTVVRFEQRIASLEAVERESLLARAQLIAAHTFDLLGSGSTDLGPRIDWCCDFKTGRRWPLDHISRIPIVIGDGSDIKVPWELSRFQHLPVLAAAHQLTNQHRWLDEIGSQLESWIAANPTEFGPNWACTMDVAIRAANWTATLAMVAPHAAGFPWFDRAVKSLLLHARFIRSHLEWAVARGNHYLSDIAGLAIVSSIFIGSREGRAWAAFSAGELGEEMFHQVRDDGCDHEASIPYHRLVTELFICGTQAAAALAPAELAPTCEARVDVMLRFVADYTRADGLAPQIGDADDGRFLPLDGYGLDPRSHEHLFRQADAAPLAQPASAAYPNGGYWIFREGDTYLIVRCGDVGVDGLGSHAHNDALSFELALGTQLLVADPGSYLYTADPAMRNRFRSTRYHSTLAIDGEEQNPIDPGSLFMMQDVRRAEALDWRIGDDEQMFVGRHHGYAVLTPPAVHTRRLELLDGGRAIRVLDTVSSDGPHQLEWTIPLAPCEAEANGSTARARFASGALLEIEAPGVELRIDPEWLSPSYGRRVSTSFVRGSKRSGPGEDRTEIWLRIT